MYAIKVNEELWRGNDGYSLRFDTKEEALEYAATHISPDDNPEVIEY